MSLVVVSTINSLTKRKQNDETTVRLQLNANSSGFGKDAATIPQAKSTN